MALCPLPATTRFASIPLFTTVSTNKRGLERCAYSPRRVPVSFKVQSFFNPFEEQPILKDALKEPVAFLGGMFAGILRLDLTEDPLKEWVARTVKASRIKPDEVVDEAGSKVDGKEDTQQIEIE